PLLPYATLFRAPPTPRATPGTSAGTSRSSWSARTARWWPGSSPRPPRWRRNWWRRWRRCCRADPYGRPRGGPARVTTGLPPTTDLPHRAPPPSPRASRGRPPVSHSRHRGASRSRLHRSSPTTVTTEPPAAGLPAPAPAYRHPPAGRAPGRGPRSAAALGDLPGPVPGRLQRLDQRRPDRVPFELPDRR